jgi:hypothetical protein
MQFNDQNLRFIEMARQHRRDLEDNMNDIAGLPRQPRPQPAPRVNVNQIHIQNKSRRSQHRHRPDD